MPARVIAMPAGTDDICRSCPRSPIVWAAPNVKDISFLFGVLQRPYDLAVSDHGEHQSQKRHPKTNTNNSAFHVAVGEKLQTLVG